MTTDSEGSGEYSESQATDIELKRRQEARQLIKDLEARGMQPTEITAYAIGHLDRASSADLDPAVLNEVLRQINPEPLSEADIAAGIEDLEYAANSGQIDYPKSKLDQGIAEAEEFANKESTDQQSKQNSSTIKIPVTSEDEEYEN